MTIEKLLWRCSEVLSNCWRGWIHAQGFLDQIFLGKSDESLVRLAKAFAGKGMCLVLGYE